MASSNTSSTATPDYGWLLTVIHKDREVPAWVIPAETKDDAKAALDAPEYGLVLHGFDYKLDKVSLL